MDEEPPFLLKQHIIEEIIVSHDYSEFPNTLILLADIIPSLDDDILFETLLYIRNAICELDDPSCIYDELYQSLLIRKEDTTDLEIHFLIDNIIVMVDGFSDDE